MGRLLTLLLYAIMLFELTAALLFDLPALCWGDVTRWKHQRRLRYVGSQRTT